MSDLFNSGLTIPGASLTAPAQSLCPGDLPLVLLPIRLETRFFMLPAGGAELRVRVFPDKIHLDSHEIDLTADEQTWGQHYWRQDWARGRGRARACRCMAPTRRSIWREARRVDRSVAHADQSRAASRGAASLPRGHRGAAG